MKVDVKPEELPTTSVAEFRWAARLKIPLAPPGWDRGIPETIDQ